MDQRPSNPLPTSWAVGVGLDVEEDRECWEVATSTGGVCNSFGEKWWCDEAGGCGWRAHRLYSGKEGDLVTRLWCTRG